MAARRCSTCNLNWPAVANVYEKCLKCGCKTDHMASLAAMTEAEAKSLKAHITFEAKLAAETPRQRRERLAGKEHRELMARVDALIARAEQIGALDQAYRRS